MTATGFALAVIFSDLPILNVASTVTLAAGVKVAITPYQPVCWVSLTPAGLLAHPPQAGPIRQGQSAAPARRPLTHPERT